MHFHLLLHCPLGDSCCKIEPFSPISTNEHLMYLSCVQETVAEGEEGDGHACEIACEGERESEGAH